MKSKNFIIPLVVYPFDVMVSIGETDKELKKQLEKNNCKWDDLLQIPEITGTGRCLQMETGQTVIRLKSFKKTADSYGTLQHEIFHAVQFLMKRLEMKLSMKNCEAYAYLIQYLTVEIYKKL